MLLNRRGAVVLAGAASVLTFGVSAPSLAANGNVQAPGDFSASNVKTVITGGNATAVATCAKIAKSGKKLKAVTICANIDATALGGDLSLKDVNVKVIQKKSVSGFTNVDTTIKGGDASSVAECINAASKAGDQKTQCDNVSATSVGGAVSLENVNIEIKTG